MAIPDKADKWAPPEGHVKISNDTLGFLTVKDDGSLYWKGKEVIIQHETKLVFSLASKIAATLVTVATISIGWVTVNSEYCWYKNVTSCRDSVNVECEGHINDNTKISFTCSDTSE